MALTLGDLCADADITSKFAQLEYKSASGSVERGRTLFEGLMSMYPKRVDLWDIYLDMEISRLGTLDDKQEAIGQIRQRFERVTSTNLSQKKMKHFFKRYLDFERQYGDESTATHVKDLAKQYIQARLAAEST